MDTVLGDSIITHISLLYASMVAHMQDLLCRFYSHMVRTCRLFRSLPTVAHLGFVITIIELSNI